MDGVTVRAVRVDDYRDIYDIMACPGVKLMPASAVSSPPP